MKYRKRDFVSERIGDELVVFDHETSRLIRLNGTAGYVWNSLKKPCTVNEVVAKAKKNFSEIPKGEIKKFINLLIKESVVEMVS